MKLYGREPLDDLTYKNNKCHDKIYHPQFKASCSHVSSKIEESNINVGLVRDFQHFIM